MVILEFHVEQEKTSPEAYELLKDSARAMIANVPLAKVTWLSQIQGVEK